MQLEEADRKVSHAVDENQLVNAMLADCGAEWSFCPKKKKEKEFTRKILSVVQAQFRLLHLLVHGRKAVCSAISRVRECFSHLSRLYEPQDFFVDFPPAEFDLLEFLNDMLFCHGK